jgi:alginate O-acetyltransferase complex protein AlgI
MLFQTLEFLILLVVVVCGVAIIRRGSIQHVFLVVASYVFYGWWDVRFLFLIVLSTVIDYAASLGLGGVRLDGPKRVRLSLIMLASAGLFLVPNWPDIQAALRAGHLPPEGTVLFGHWEGFGPALVLAIGFGVLGPLLYGLYFHLGENGRRRAFLITSIVANLGVLAFFKYFNFFTESAETLAAELGADWTSPALQVALPVGISFYTFQTMSYTIDVFRGQLAPERSFIRVALYVAYFPQLVAGPILRPQQLLPSLARPWVLKGDNVRSGLHLALQGLAKKVLIADNVAPLVDAVFDAPQGQSSLVVVLAVSLFAIQIYCDFSGYTDIARGISRMFGVEIPLNFDFPYFATSIVQFWRRWHISLSSWLRDYLYIPLGGSRVAIPLVYANVMITMVLGGLWHGASWNFVIWGIYQGALLCANRLIASTLGTIPRLRAAAESTPGLVLRWGVTLYCWLLGWLIFRLTNFSDMRYCIEKYVLFDGGMSPSALAGVGLGGTGPFTAVAAAAVFVVLHAYDYFLRVRTGKTYADWLDGAPLPIRGAVYAAAGATFFFLWPADQTPFIYFQF